MQVTIGSRPARQCEDCDAVLPDAGRDAEQQADRAHEWLPRATTTAAPVAQAGVQNPPPPAQGGGEIAPPVATSRAETWALDDPRRSVRAPEGQAVLLAHKLRTAADRLQRDIDKPKPYDGMNPTRKRLQAWTQHAKQRARYEQLQAALRLLAGWHESGAWPEWRWSDVREGEHVDMLQPYLDPDDGQRPVTTECTAGHFGKAIQMLQGLRSAEDVRDVLYPWGLDAMAVEPRAVARWLLLTAAPLDPERERRRKIEQAERELLSLKLPGYFPTPPEIARQMVDAAEIEPGMRVLEPSAGSGSIADALVHWMDGDPIGLQLVEQSPRLCELLRLKGYDPLQADFLSMGPWTVHRAARQEFDRVLMNPPFEDGQDAVHVMHAYTLLAPGGRLVALMSPGPFQRNDAKARGFRDWLGAVVEQFTEPGAAALDFAANAAVRDHRIGGGSMQWQTLPDGSFEKSGTGVAVRMVVIDKPGAAEEAPDVDCLTRPDGACISERDCMHGPGARPDFGGLEALYAEGE